MLLEERKRFFLKRTPERGHRALSCGIALPLEALLKKHSIGNADIDRMLAEPALAFSQASFHYHFSRHALQNNIAPPENIRRGDSSSRKPDLLGSGRAAQAAQQGTRLRCCFNPVDMATHWAESRRSCDLS